MANHNAIYFKCISVCNRFINDFNTLAVSPMLIFQPLIIFMDLRL